MKMGSKFRVGIVDLGSMRTGAALLCIRAGLSTWGADLSGNTCTTLKEVGAYGVSGNAAMFAEKPDTLLVLVANVAQVEQVLFGETDVAQHLEPDTAVMVSSTTANADTQEIATALAGFGLEMLDAPVSDDAVKAVNGEMTVVASGSDIAFERLAPVLETVAGRVYRIGAEPGLGPIVKIIRQLLVGVHIAARVEAMVLAARVGIPLDMMYDVVTNTARSSWMFESRTYHVVGDSYTPHLAVNISVKDLGLVADIAKTLHLPLPLASTALNIFTSTNSAGCGKKDDNTVIKIFSGVTLPGTKS